MTQSKLQKRAVRMAYLFAVLLVLTTGVLIWSTSRLTWDWGWIILAAAFGSGAGLLGATLDHVNLRVKQDALEKINDAQKAYLAVRCSMALALGIGAAIVAEAVLSTKEAAAATAGGKLELLCVAAFAAAYLFDISKLSPAK